MALRTALGARRGRIVRQLLTESVVLAMLGSAGAVLLAMCGVGGDGVRHREPGVRGAAPCRLRPGLACARRDDGVAVLAGVIAGLAPAWYAHRADVNSLLKTGGRTHEGSGRGRLRGAAGRRTGRRVARAAHRRRPVRQDAGARAERGPGLPVGSRPADHSGSAPARPTRPRRGQRTIETRASASPRCQACPPRPGSPARRSAFEQDQAALFSATDRPRRRRRTGSLDVERARDPRVLPGGAAWRSSPDGGSTIGTSMTLGRSPSSTRRWHVSCGPARARWASAADAADRGARRSRRHRRRRQVHPALGSAARRCCFCRSRSGRRRRRRWKSLPAGAARRHRQRRAVRRSERSTRTFPPTASRRWPTISSAATRF